MKINILSKTISAVVLTTIASSAMANTAMTTGQITEKTGEKLTSLTDSMYTKLTGKTVNSIDVVHPVALTDYQQVDSGYEDAYINGSFNLQGGKDKDTSYNVDLGADYETVMASANANTKYSADIAAYIYDDGDDSTDTVEKYNAHAAANYDRYFNAQKNDAFWYGKGEARVQQEEGEDYAGLENPEIKISGGVGYGRVVNVTPMAQATRLVEALMEDGALSGTPSTEVYQKLASVISQKESYVKANPENYSKYWMADIEKALGVGLGASAAISAYDSLVNDNVSTRKSGWDVRAGAGVVATDFAGDTGKPLLEVQGNYYLPISNKTQFSNQARVSAQLDDDNDSYVFANSMGLSYELSDRVDWQNKWNLNYDSNDGLPDIMTNTLSSSFLYEVSNSLDYETSINFSHLDVEDVGSTYDQSLYMGVVYRMK